MGNVIVAVMVFVEVSKTETLSEFGLVIYKKFAETKLVEKMKIPNRPFRRNLFEILQLFLQDFNFFFINFPSPI